MRLRILFIVFFLGIFSSLSAQRKVGGAINGSIYSLYANVDNKGISIREKTLEKSKSGDAYDFMSLRGVLGAFNALIENSNGDSSLINQQRQIIDNIIHSAQYSDEIPNNESYRDHFKGWISLKPRYAYHKEVVLYEGYAFFYITQFLYYLKASGWVDESSEHQSWWEDKIKFIEQNIWEKWVTRCQKYKKNKYWYFLRGRTHMGSHWAGVAMYLGRMTSDSLIKAECQEDQREYDLLLKRNLKPNPEYPSAYVWNQTYDNVAGTDATATRPGIIQDVSHGNHVVAYIVAAYEMGDKNWSLADIHKLCNTLKNVIYNKETHSFADNVDGTDGPSRPGWGNFVGDGWVNLSKFDLEVKNIFAQFSKNTRILKKYGQELQFKANFLYFGRSHH